MATSPSANGAAPIAPGVVAIALLKILSVGGPLALLFWALDEPVLLGVTVGLTALLVLVGVGLLFDPSERQPSIQELAEQERLARQATAALEAETDQRTAELMRRFLDHLPPDERALLGLRMLAEARVARTVEELEREISALRGDSLRRIR